MFDYNTISDVVLHFDYTASFDGARRDVAQDVKTEVVAAFGLEPRTFVIHLEHMNEHIGPDN